LAGAVAYYTLLSLVPALILVVIALAKVVDESLLLATLGDYLEFAVPGQSQAIVSELTTFLAHREAVGGVLLVTMVFFSALAFTVLENAMSVIFFHRVAIRRRHFLVSALMPYLFIVFLALGLLLVTIVAGRLDALASRNITVFGELRALGGLSATLLYLLGVGGEVLLLTAIYMVMPVGRLSWRHALLGGVAAAILWEITRRVLVWYFATISQIQVVYGSLTSAIAVLLSVEMGALVLLLGAQVIAEYERTGREPIERPSPALDTSRAVVRASV
jgi:YihY family inner membrane protein